jgi:hypothetical protein
MGGFNMNGSGRSDADARFECDGSTSGTFSGNSVVNWGGGMNGAFSIQGCNGDSWVGNSIPTFASGTYVFYVQANSTWPNASNNTFTGNIVALPNSRACFHPLSNFASGFVINNTISGDYCTRQQHLRGKRRAVRLWCRDRDWQ